MDKNKVNEILGQYEGMFNDEQLNWIRYGLDCGFDVSVYAKPEFDGCRCVKS
ncbi:MAG: hypothetical protein HUJ53_05790 [Holdemanella sp.]|nr:hypothetical protein [Holdemanella sp.]